MVGKVLSAEDHGLCRVVGGELGLGWPGRARPRVELSVEKPRNLAAAWLPRLTRPYLSSATWEKAADMDPDYAVSGAWVFMSKTVRSPSILAALPGRSIGVAPITRSAVMTCRSLRDPASAELQVSNSGSRLSNSVKAPCRCACSRRHRPCVES